MLIPTAPARTAKCSLSAPVPSMPMVSLTKDTPMILRMRPLMTSAEGPSIMLLIGTRYHKSRTEKPIYGIRVTSLSFHSGMPLPVVLSVSTT